MESLDTFDQSVHQAQIVIADGETTDYEFHVPFSRFRREMKGWVRRIDRNKITVIIQRNNQDIAAVVPYKE